MNRYFITIVISIIILVQPIWAAPVEWVEVPSTELGQQWWDRGSIRKEKDGTLMVLSRFTPASSLDTENRNGELYVMELDCSQKLYRDKQVNGIPKFKAKWQPAAKEDLTMSVINAVCSEQLSK